MNTLYRNARIGGVDLDILCRDGRILRFVSAGDGASTGQSTATVVDLGGRPVIPGYVNAHAHLDKAYLLGSAPYVDVSGPEKGALIRAKKASQTVADIRARAERVVTEAIDTGCRVLRTNVDVDGEYRLRAIEALLELREAYRNELVLQIVAFAQEGFDRYPETEELLDEAIRMGSDAVGGHTLVDADGKGHIDRVLAIAQRHDVECEYHVDESGKAEHFLLPYLSERVKETGYHGRVNAIHACSLASVPDDVAAATIASCKEAGVRFIVAPTAISTRTLTRVRELVAADVPVAVGTDNIGDNFNPIGSANVVPVAYLLAYVERLFTNELLDALFAMITTGGAEVCGAVGEYGLAEDGDASFLVLPTQDVRDVFRNPCVRPMIVVAGAERP